jgi:hypothetical protein
MEIKLGRYQHIDALAQNDIFIFGYDSEFVYLKKSLLKGDKKQNTNLAKVFISTHKLKNRVDV